MSLGVISEFYWPSVAGDGSINFVVQQIGAKILFIQVGSNVPLSGGEFGTLLNLEAFVTPGAPDPSTLACQYAAGYGYLFIAHSYCDPIYVIFDPSAQAFTFHSITIQQRDISGLREDGDPPSNQRPTTLTTKHYYNLMNQGWTTNNTSAGSHLSGESFTYNSFSGYIDLFARPSTAIGGYPSNSDLWYLYKDSFQLFNPASVAGTVSAFNSPAPRGHYILNAFYQDRQAIFNAEAASIPVFDATTSDASPRNGTATPIAGIAVVSAGFQRPGAVAFFAGRVFYAGVQAQGFSNQIYYSQVIQDPTYFGKCYQADDPTASDTGVADLLDSDGGVLILPEIGQVYRLFPLAYSLIIFASNGVWAVSGSTGSGFRATDFSVSKISSVGMISNQSFIDLDGNPIWWNLDGIFTLSGSNPLSPNASAGTTALNITDPVIKTFIDTIPAESKKYSKGSYNRGLYTVYWLYTRTAPTTIDERYQYTDCLCFNTNTRAFYNWELPSGSSTASDFTDMWISGIVTVQGAGTSYALTNVVDGFGATVTDGASDDVQTNAPVTTEHQSVTKFLVQYIDATTVLQLTYAENNDVSYKDFQDIDYQSFFVGGYALDGQAVAKFQSPYIVVYANDQVANGFGLNAIWDFATDLVIYTNKTGTLQMFRSEGGSHDWRAYRRKLRGMGRAMQIKVSSISGLPFEIAGWGIEISPNTGA